MKKILHIIKSPLGSAVLGGVLFLGTFGYSVTKARPTKESLQDSEQQKPKVNRIGPSWTFHNPEIELLVQELREQEEELAAWKAELEQLELRLKAEREELRKTADEVRALQTDFDKGLIRMDQAEAQNLKKMAQIYTKMKPDSALKIIQEFDDRQIVKILQVLPEKTTVAMLEQLAGAEGDRAVRAARISEYLRLSIETNDDADI